ncbi:MAG: hypothetical protein WCO45_17755, partial [Pseudanabaena sp. ELA607]
SMGQLLAANSMSGNFLGFIGAVIGFVDEFMRVKTATQRKIKALIETHSQCASTAPFLKPQSYYHQSVYWQKQKSLDKWDDGSFCQNKSVEYQAFWQMQRIDRA